MVSKGGNVLFSVSVTCVTSSWDTVNSKRGFSIDRGEWGKVLFPVTLDLFRSFFCFQ